MKKEYLKTTIKYYLICFCKVLIVPFVKIEHIYKNYKKLLIMDYINNIILSHYNFMSEEYVNAMLQLNSPKAKKYIKEFNFA